MIISDQAIVTAYCDTMAALLTLGLLILNSRSKYMTADPGGRMFRILCIGVFISSIANGISYALHGQGLTLPQPILLIAPTIAELSVLITLFFWLIYVDYRIYSSVDRLRFGYRVFAIPVYIFIILSIINFFYPILFYMDENTNFAAKPLFYVMSVMQYFYGIFPVAVILKYYKNHGKLHFFHITPVAVPVTITALFTISTQYSARSFGFAIALIFLHFSHVDRWRFDDIESGFFNKYYINYILTALGEKGRDYHCAITFWADKPSESFYEILRNELPNDAEVIRMDEHRFLLFSENSSASMVKLLREMIQSAADSYDELHPEEKINLVITHNNRDRNETIEDFIHMAAEM